MIEGLQVVNAIICDPNKFLFKKSNFWYLFKLLCIDLIELTYLVKWFSGEYMELSEHIKLEGEKELVEGFLKLGFMCERQD